MNTTTPTTPPPANAVAEDSDNVEIAIAIFAPFDCSNIPRPVAESLRGLGMDKAIVLLTLGQLLQSAFRSQGFPCERLLPVGTAYDGYIRFEVPMPLRVEALEATEAFCKGCFWLNHFATVAWYCAAECAWRAHRNSSSAIRLEKFFTPESTQVHLAAMEETVRILDSVNAHLNGLDPLTGES